MQTGEVAWWAAADSLAARLRVGPVPDIGAWYRIADALLAVRSGALPFVDRFRLLFGGCAVDGPDQGLPAVVGSVRLAEGERGVLITLDGQTPEDLAGVVGAVFEDDGVRGVGDHGSWRGFAGDGDWRMAVRGREVVVASGGPWPYVAGALLVHATMCAQPGTLFLHAAALQVVGRGVLLVGPTGSGKTTLAVGLAARGHGYLSDEVGAIRLDGPDLLPFPRAAGVRPGPQGREAAELVAQPELPIERFADGGTKTLIGPDRLGRVPLGTPVPLRDIVILERRGDAPAMETVEAAPALLPHLTPSKSTPFSQASGMKTLRLLQLASRVQWHRLTAGPPDETISLIERQLGAP